MTNARIISLTASIENFEAARERLLVKRMQADEAAGNHLAESLMKNQEAIDRLRTELRDEVARLNQVEDPRAEQRTPGLQSRDA